MLRYEFLCKYPPWYVLLFLNLYIYVFYQIWETFGCHKSSFTALLPFIPHFFLWISNYTCLESFNIVPPVPQSLFPTIPFGLFPPLWSSDCIISVSSSSVTLLSSPVLLLEWLRNNLMLFFLFIEFFTSGIIFFSVRVFVWLFYSFYFFAEISYLCIYFKHLLI